MITKRKILASLTALAFFLVGVPYAHAGPIYVAPTVQTATATSTVNYLSPGLATTTLTYDSYAPPTDTKTFAANSVGLLLQFAASSTASTLKIAEEFSEDGIDWYQPYGAPTSLTATTSLPTLTTPFTYSFPFASTTVDGVAHTNANTATSTAFIQLISPMRFLRVVTSITGAGAAIWEQLIPIKETP